MLIYSDKIKSIFRYWQRRNAVCFGVTSAKGKKTAIYHCIVFIPSSIKFSMEENVVLLESGSLIEMFSQPRLQWKKTLVQNCETSRLPQTMNHFVSYVNFTFFFMSDSFSEEGCHVVTSKSNSEETVCRCNHLTHFAVLMDYDGSTKVIKLYLPY